MVDIHCIHLINGRINKIRTELSTTCRETSNSYICIEASIPYLRGLSTRRTKITSKMSLDIFEIGRHLDKLLERAVNWRANVGDVLPEVNRGNGTLGDAFGRKLKLL